MSYQTKDKLIEYSMNSAIIAVGAYCSWRLLASIFGFVSW